MSKRRMNRRSFFKQGVACSLGISIGASSGASAAARGSSDLKPLHGWPLKIGYRKQLLVDDHILSERRDVIRRLGQGTKLNGGKPIFAEGWFAATVLYDNDLFKMWYIPRDQDFSREERLKGAYAESQDGLNWTKRADLAGPVGAHLAVLLDPHEEDPQHRYKAGYHPESPPYGACLSHSSDGIKWTSYNSGKPVTYRAADTWNQLLWDEEAQLYRLITRTDFGDPGGAGEIRGTRTMVNPDVKANPTGWTTIRSWRFDQEGHEEYKRRQLYAMTDWIYEGVHFGLVSVYEWVGDLSEGPYDTHRRHERGIQNFYIATCRDADNWDQSWIYAGIPLIPRGQDGSFDKDSVYPPHLIVTHQDKHWVFYGGGRERHDIARARDDYAIGLATFRLDGFAYLEAQNQAGAVLTKPFQLEGSKLEVNVDATDGEVAVEVLDALQSGTAVPGFSHNEAQVVKAVDELRLQPRWKGHADLAVLRGKVVRLKFHLRNAKLYAFHIRP